MSGDTWFPRADYERFGFSHQMIEHLRWMTEGVCAATGAQTNDFSTFSDQEGLGLAFDYQAPASGDGDGAGLGGFGIDYGARDAAAGALGQSVGIGDPSAIFAEIARLRDDVQGMCATIETRDQEIAVLRGKIRDLECLYA